VIATAPAELILYVPPGRARRARTPALDQGALHRAPQRVYRDSAPSRLPSI